MLEADINLSVLNENLNNIKAFVGTKICFVVKADAYGHGLVPISKSAEKNVDEFAVATLDEAFTLIESGITKPINILGCIDKSFFDKKNLIYSTMSNIIPTICEIDELKYLNPDINKINIKINTGMNRLGVKPQNLKKLIDELEIKRVKIKSFFTHFLKADDSEITKNQLEIFLKAIEPFKGCKALAHAAASNCLSLGKEYYMDMVRAGIAAYGYGSVTNPIEKIYTNILQCYDVKAGSFMGYGGETIGSDTKVAIIRAGYGDGYRRRLDLKSQDRFVSINNILCPVIGQICMDLTAVDVSKISIRGNERVYLLGNGVTGEALAKSYNSIIYEVLTSFNSGRIKKNYIETKKDVR